MIKKLLIIAILIYCLFISIKWVLRFLDGYKTIQSSFSSGNVIVFGKKGKGKDLIFNYAINTRGIRCASNIPFNKDICKVRPIKDYNLDPNTFENMLNDNVKICKKTINEGEDYYISDGGIFLPSQYEGMLCKLYPSLPMFYATSRHLAQMNIHINSQYLGRVWDKLREQANTYIKCIESNKLFNKYIITKCIFYDQYKTAMAEMLPFPKQLFESKENKSKRIEFEAHNGIVKYFYVIQKIKHIYYDTRYFHKVFYGKFAPIEYVNEIKTPKYYI